MLLARSLRAAAAAALRPPLPAPRRPLSSASPRALLPPPAAAPALARSLAPQPSSLTNSWYFAAESSHFYSASASAMFGGSPAFPAYSCGQLPAGCEQPSAVRRRARQADRGDSRRSWHEESSFEKQFKRRSCQMEFGESILSDNRSREELGKVGSQSSFSGSMEIIEVS